MFGWVALVLLTFAVVSMLSMLTDAHRHLRTLIAQGVLMAIPAELTTAITALTTAASDIGTKIAALTAQIGTGMTQAEVDSVTQQLTTLASQLEALSK